MAEVKEYSLKIDTKTAQANVDELNKSLELQEDLINDIEKELSSYQNQLEKTSKKDLAARKSLNDKIKKTKSNLNQEKQGLKDVKIARDKSNKALKEATENSADYGGVLGMIDSKTGGVISGFSGMTKSIGAATKGFNLMKIAIIGTGIGALLIALTALGQAFKSSEEGQNSWNKLMGVLGAVVDVFTDKLAALGRFLINLFTSPIETLKNFGNSIKEFVMDKVEKVIEGLGFMGKAISKLFKGDFAGAMDAGKQGLSSLNEGLNTAKMLTDAVTKGTKELIKEIEREAKIAAKIADQRAKADKLERGIIVDRAKADRKRATLLEQAVNKEKFTLQERIAFLVEAGKLEDEITAKEIEAAKLRLKAKIAENALGDSTKESLEEEANLKAVLIQLETAKLTKAKEVTSQIIGLRNEERAANKARYEERKANEQAIVDFKKSLMIEDKNNKFAAIEEERKQRILELKELKASETEKQKMLLDIKKSFDHQKKIIEEENQKATDAEELAKSQKLAALKKQIRDAEAISEQDKRDLELVKIQEQYQALILQAQENNIKTDELKLVRDAILKEKQDEFDQADLQRKKTIAEEEAKIEEQKRQQQQQTLNNLISIGGAESKFGKAMLVAKQLLLAKEMIMEIKATLFSAKQSATKTVVKSAEAGVDVASGAAKAASAAPFPANIPLIIGYAAQAVGIVSAIKGAMKASKQATSKVGATSSSSSISTPSAGAGSAPSAPAFNVVGASDTNQLADAIGGQSQQPIQTYVVASDVSTAQELDRNIVTGATIG